MYITTIMPASPHAANYKESTWMYQKTFKFHYRCLNIVEVKKGQREIHRITPEIRFLTISEVRQTINYIKPRFQWG